ncbi:hypothetical protein [Cyanobium sp. CH-040]|nr:hypothetical protein [Cyanobium sp. CH-040]
MGVPQAARVVSGPWPGLGQRQRCAALRVERQWRCGRADAPLTLE